MVFNFFSSCSHLPSNVSTGVSHYTSFIWYFVHFRQVLYQWSYSPSPLLPCKKVVLPTNTFTFHPLDRASLCSSGGPGAGSVDQAGLKLKRSTCLCLRNAGILFKLWNRLSLSSLALNSPCMSSRAFPLLTSDSQQWILQTFTTVHHLLCMSLSHENNGEPYEEL